MTLALRLLKLHMGTRPALGGPLLRAPNLPQRPSRLHVPPDPLQRPSLLHNKDHARKLPPQAVQALSQPRSPSKISQRNRGVFRKPRITWKQSGNAQRPQDTQGVSGSSRNTQKPSEHSQSHPGASNKLPRAPGSTQDRVRTLEAKLSLGTKTRMNKSTPVGFEPTRGDPIGLAGRRLSHSAKVSLKRRARQGLLNASVRSSLNRMLPSLFSRLLGLVA